MSAIMIGRGDNNGKSARRRAYQGVAFDNEGSERGWAYHPISDFTRDGER